MSNYILAVLTCLCCIQGQTQRTWGNYEGNIGGELYTILHECHDTTINGETWTAVRAYTWNPWFQGPERSRPRGYIRTDGKKSYWNISGKKILLYDMGMELGDTIRLGRLPRNNVFELVGIDSIEVFGEERRRQRMRHIDLSVEDVWVEGIGSTKNHYLWSGQSDMIPDGGSWSVCYREKGGSEVWKLDNDTLTCFMENYRTGCDSLLSTSETEDEHHLFPNPWLISEQGLRIVGRDENTQITIYSITGRKEYEGGIGEISKDELRSGYYLIKCQERGRAKYYRLLVN